jgi:NPCBM/NEW2 domain-containing protein
LVNGNESPNGLSMCPNSNTYAEAKYRLGKAAKTFLASVALNDSAGGAGLAPGVGRIPTPLIFQVVGDSKLLWKSKPVDVSRSVQECKVDVSAVNVLELRVACPGSYVNAQAVWLEPRVEIASPMPVRRSAVVGGLEGGEPYEHTGGRGCFLTGFAYRTRFGRNTSHIACLQAIYWIPGGRTILSPSIGHLPDSTAHPPVNAKVGYAVGGIKVWSSTEGGFHLVRGIKLQFMRRNGNVLDPEDSYWSEWIGLNGEGKGTLVGGDGFPVVGIHGRAGGGIDALGIIQSR